MSMNRVMVTGNLTRDPELRQTQTGLSILSISIAVNDRRRNQETGEWSDYANFIDCVMFGARAESVAKYLSKGAKVAIDGKLRWSQWENDGQKRSRIQVMIEDIEFLTSRNDQNHNSMNGSNNNYAASNQSYGGSPVAQTVYAGGSTQPAPEAYGAPSTSAASVETNASNNIYDDDIPF